MKDNIRTFTAANRKENLLKYLYLMKDEVNSQPVKLVIEHIKKQIAERRILPGERLPSERKLSELLQVSRSHVREALQKMELYGIVKIYPQSGTVVSEFSKDQLDTMITDALKISKYDFSSLVYVRVLLEIELEEKFDTELRVEKDFAFHQAIAQGGHNPVISSLLLIITPDILKYYQKYKVCAVPQKTVHAEHREMLQKIKDKDKDGMKELVLRHLSNLIDFAKLSTKGEIPEFEYGHI